jgi:hypothetical protein
LVSYGIVSIMTFGVSAYLAAMHAPAPKELVKEQVEKLLAILDENDPNLVAELGNISVNRATLAELALWNARLAPSDQRDRLGHAAVRFFAVQTLATTVMRQSTLDSAARFSSGVARVLEKGALGLFEVGQSQFVALARETRAIADWLAARSPKSVALIESPISNSLPVQLLRELLERQGVKVSTVVWNGPRNDRPSRGRTVEQAAEDCAAATSGHDYVVVVDEVLSGSRLLKLSGALAEKVETSRFIPVAMVFSDSFRPAPTAHANRTRLKAKLEEQASKNGYPRPWVEFPVHRLFKIDDGNFVRWPTPAIWGDCEIAAGKRKVNLIFALLEHFFQLLEDLAADQSTFRPYLELAWRQNTAGQGFAFGPGAMRGLFVEIVTKLPLDDFRDRLRDEAKRRFPADYTGGIESLDRPEAARRFEWIRDAFVSGAKKRVGEQLAWTAWNAIDAAFVASFPDYKPRAPRDEDAAPYTLPFNETVRAFNRRLLAKLVELAMQSQ